jgi:tellurium resistance protein TerD
MVADYDLDEMFSNETAVQFGSFFKLDGEWLFKAVGAGYRLGLGDFVDGYK